LQESNRKQGFLLLLLLLLHCRGKGRLVVTASMAAKVPSPGQAVYSAAKMAVWGYFGSLATEVADK
jgi:dehydrogenase/reductase SDR family protein 7